MGTNESFDFLNELALAFRRGEKYARPQHTPILEGVRAVLAHLTAAGRLVPAGGMALTAEQVEDVRTVMGDDGELPMMGEFWAACDRLRALLPATEPAGERCQKWTVRVAGGIETGIQCVLPAGHECFHDYVPPAPAEPTEEETKAEAQRTDGDFTVLGPEIFTDATGEFICWKGVNYARIEDSPVVPAPTETGPWQRIEDVPEGVLQIKDRHGRTWLVVGGTWRFEWHDGNWYEPHTNINAQAPFVAAEGS